MGKRDNIRELAVFIMQAIAHRIGHIIDPNAIHAEKYRKEVINLMDRAKKVKIREHWNYSDLAAIKIEVKNKLVKELTRREYIDNKKFDIMDEEIEKALKELELD